MDFIKSTGGGKKMQIKSKSFYHKDDNCLAVCDLTQIDKYFVEQYNIDSKYQDWYYFNRLNIPVRLRQQGIAKKLLQEMIEWADLEKINILLDINPYGDLSYEQLEVLYQKFGFQKLEKCYVRYFKEQEEK